MFLRARRAAVPAALTVLSIVVTGLVPPAPAAAAEEPVLTPEAQASLQARSTGSPVEVPSLLTENTKVIANPDGTFTAEVHAGPARFRDTAGAWREVDLDLERRPDGTVAPKAHPRGLVLSGEAGAGDHDVAQLATGSLSLALGWTGVLPQPELNGTEATYREVRPGVDLVIDATRTGFEQFLVVKNRAAASQVREVTMPWRTTGITPTARSGGGLTLTDDSGAYVGHVPPAVMWDDTVSEVSGEPLHEVTIPMRAPAGPRSTIAISPDDAFLQDSDTVYPVTIDPSPTLKPVYDAFVQDNISSDKSTSKELKLGYVMDRGRYYKARSFIKWSTGVLKGKNVTKAVMSLWNTHSWNCTPKEWQVWVTDGVGTSTRWGKQPKWHSARPIATSTMTKGYSGCGSGYVTADVGPLFDWAADNGQQYLSTGLRSKPSDEGSIDAHSWKKFSSSEDKKDPFVSVTYNTRPAPPTGLRIGGKDCTGGTTGYVSSIAGYPSAQATAIDPDGTEKSLTVQYFVAKAGSGLPSAPTMTGKATSGTIATAKVPASVNLTENQTYQMYARTTDGLDTSVTSVPCTFTVDNSGPAKPPTVTSAEYPECLSDCFPGHGGVGRSGRFTFGANGASDVTHFRYKFDSGPQVTVAAETAGGTATVWADPPPTSGGRKIDHLYFGGPRTLHVESLDAAGHPSGEYETTIGGEPRGGYPIFVKDGPVPPVARWKLDEPSGSTAFADSSGNDRTLTLSGSATNSAGNGDGGRAVVLDGNGHLGTPLAVSLERSRSVAASVRIDDFSETAPIVRNLDGSVNPIRQTIDELYVDAAAKKFCFRTRFSNVGQYNVCSAAVARPGVWNRISGGFDAMERRVFVSVNGMLTSDSTITPAGGLEGLGKPGQSTSIGIGSYDLTSRKSPMLRGAVDDVRIWDRLVHPDELGMLSVTEVGRWDLDIDGSDSSAHPSAHTLLPTSVRDDLWTDYGHNVADIGSAWFDGTDSLSSDTGNVLRTDQSFSVSAWVSAAEAPIRSQTAISLDGTNQSGFGLGVRVISGVPRWNFGFPNADSPTSSPSLHASGPPIAPDIDGWVHLVGVYDAAAQKAHLYMNGERVSTIDRTPRWQASGKLHLGKSHYQGADYDFFKGRVDAVRLYSGVLNATMVSRLHNTPDGQL